MDRKFAKKILAEAMENTSHGRAVRAYVGLVGEEETCAQMESFRDTMWAPRGFLEAENYLGQFDRHVYEAGSIGASAVAVFSVLGVTALVQEAYHNYTDLPLNETIMKTPSKTQAEPKAWTGDPDYPQALADLEEPDLTRLLQRSEVVPNMDFGRAFQISRRAIDDDQVGQLATYPARLGKKHIEQEEIWAGATLTGETWNNFGISIPAATYQDPDGTAGVYTTSTGTNGIQRTNALSDTAFSATSLIDLLNLTKEITDWAGKPILIRPDLIIGGTSLTLLAAQVLNSAFWPSTSNTSGADASINIGTLAVNPLDPKWKALRCPIDYREEPFWNKGNYRKRWHLIQSGKGGGIGLVQQDRQALEVLMEAPNAGVSIRTRSYYHRTYRRCAWYIAEARYVARGSTGTV